MARQHILVVDDDQKSLQVLEISLKKAGFLVTTAQNGLDGLEKAKTSVPELIISDVKMPKLNGYQFCKRIKEDPKLEKVPFIFLTSQKSVDDKIKGLELGVDDYLTKPIYIKELLTRVRLLLQKREKESLEEVSAQRQFAGSLTDMGVVDLLQTLEIGRKTGVLYLTGPGASSGLIYFSEGQIIDAIQGQIKAERAIYRMLAWNEGAFKIDFKPLDRQVVVSTSTQGLIMDGMRRLDEWERLAEQLPPLDTVLIIDPQELLVQYPEKFPTKAGQILQLFDGTRTILTVVDSCGLDDLPALNIISKLYFQGLLKELEQGATPPMITMASAQPAQPSNVVEFPSQPPEPASEPAGSMPDDFGDSAGEVSAVSVRDLLASTHVSPAPVPASVPQPAAASMEDIAAQAEARALSQPPPPPPPEETDEEATEPSAEMPSPRVAAPHAQKSGRQDKVYEVEDEVKLVSPKPWQRHPALFAGVGGALGVLLLIAGAAAFGLLAPLGVPALIGGSSAPNLKPIEAQVALHVPAALQGAVAKIDGFSESQETLPEVAALKARALLRLGMLEDNVGGALKDADSALRLVDDAGQRTPVVQVTWAELDVLRGRFDDARKRAQPFLSASDSATAGWAAYVSGLADLREGKNLGQAIELLGSAERALPGSVAVALALSEALLRVSDYDKAREQASRAASESARSAEAQELLARACAALRDRDCARGAWDRAVSLAPDNAQFALGQASNLWQEEKNAGEAGAKLKSIVSNENWKDESEVRARAYFLLGEIAAAGGDNDAARDYYEKVQAIDSGYPGLSSRLAALRPARRPAPKPAPVDPATEGRRLLRKGQYRAAIPFLQKAVLQDSRDAELFSELGNAYLQIDESDSARRSFERALKLDRNNATALRWLGQLYSTAGEREQAAVMFERFLKVAPTHPDAPLVRALLRRIER
ncbi:MAG: response regulator [Chrysiogenetes bacterium]|nr:response regulator [Chrysiogenetes bacterium]